MGRDHQRHLHNRQLHPTDSGRAEFYELRSGLVYLGKTGQRVDQVLPTALQVQEERLVRIPTSQLNRIFQSAQDLHPAPGHAGRSLHLYYGTQVRNDPPTFLIYVNDPKLAHFTYIRFLENRIRMEYGFLGTPIQLVLRPRRE